MSYKEIQAMNQSLLKTILKGPRKFLETQEKYLLQEENKANGIREVIPKHFIFGSALDHMLTEDVEFEDVFYVMEDIDKPSDTVCGIINVVFNEYYDPRMLQKQSLSDFKGAIIESAARCSYQSNWKADTIFDKIVEGGSAYFEQLKESVGKTIITREEYSRVVIAASSLKSDPYTSFYLKKTKDIEIIKKPIFQFTFQGINFKGEGDLITIDHKNKKIYPLDIKSTGTDVLTFPSQSFFKLRYDIQAAFYSKGINEYPPVKELIEKGYTVEYFKFLVVNSNNIGLPMVYTTTHETIRLGQLGGVRSNGIKLEGIVQCIKRYKYHLESGNWDHLAEYYECGELKLEV